MSDPLAWILILLVLLVWVICTGISEILNRNKTRIPKTQDTNNQNKDKSVVVEDDFLVQMNCNTIHYINETMINILSTIADIKTCNVDIGAVKMAVNSNDVDKLNIKKNMLIDKLAVQTIEFKNYYETVKHIFDYNSSKKYDEILRECEDIIATKTKIK